MWKLSSSQYATRTGKLSRVVPRFQPTERRVELSPLVAESPASSFFVGPQHSGARRLPSGLYPIGFCKPCPIVPGDSPSLYDASLRSQVDGIAVSGGERMPRRLPRDVRITSILCSPAVALFVVSMVAATGGCSSSPPISVNLSPSTPQAMDQGQTVKITVTVTNDTSSKGVAWSLTGPGSLSNMTGPSVTYTPPTAILTSGQLATVTATSEADQRKSASVQITVNPYLQIPFQTLPSGSVGTPYSQTIALAGGTSPIQWSVYDGPILTGYLVCGFCSGAGI